GAAFSPDGRHAVTCGRDNFVILWDIAKGTVVRKLAGHTEPVRAVAWAPQRFEAASVSTDGTIRIWDLKSGSSRELRLTAEAPSKSRKGLLAVAYSPSGRRLLTGGEDGMVRLWNVATGEQAYCFQGHTDAVNGVALSADGRRALSGSSDRTVRLWELPGE